MLNIGWGMVDLIRAMTDEMPSCSGGQEVATIFRGRVLLKGTGPMEMYRVEGAPPSGHAGGHEGGHAGGHEGGHGGGHAAREGRVPSSSPDDDLFARVTSDTGNKS